MSTHKLSVVTTTSSQQVIGMELDDFVLPSIGGGESSLQAHIESHKGVVVLFWSGVCSHCVHYDGYLNDFRRRHPEMGLVAVASRQGESVDDIRKVITERKLTFPILHDANGQIAAQWHTQQTPRAFLLDAKRTLLYRGAIDNFKFSEDPEFQAYLETAIEQFLAGKPVARTETSSFGCAVKSVFYRLPAKIARA